MTPYKAIAGVVIVGAIANESGLGAAVEVEGGAIGVELLGCTVLGVLTVVLTAAKQYGQLGRKGGTAECRKTGTLEQAISAGN